jgi:hypothetical protein
MVNAGMPQLPAVLSWPVSEIFKGRECFVHSLTSEALFAQRYGQ